MNINAISPIRFNLFKTTKNNNQYNSGYFENFQINNTYPKNYFLFNFKKPNQISFGETNRKLIEPLVKSFKSVENTDNWKIVSINGMNLYYFSLTTSLGAKQSAIIITNNSKDVQYTFVI